MVFLSGDVYAEVGFPLWEPTPACVKKRGVVALSLGSRGGSTP